MTPKEMADGLAMFFWSVMRFVALGIVLSVVFKLVFDERYSLDDTDTQSDRSGVVLRTDYGTGCQYLETMSGGITPRLNKSGRQAGCR